MRIPKAKVCDDISTCQDASDECKDCQKASFSSYSDLFASIYFHGHIIVAFVLVLTLGCYALKLQAEKKPSQKPGKVDRMLCISMTTFDLLMGFYLGVLIVQGFRYRNRYCSVDIEWRSSMLCKISSIVYQVSSLRSLFTTLLMTCIRCYCCVFTLKSGISIQSCFALLSVITFVIFLTVLSPFMIVNYANFGDTFVEKYYFEDNPISPMATKKDLARIVTVIEKQNITEASEIGASWRAGTMMRTLQGLSSMNTLFSRSTMATAGYYGPTGFCIPNLANTNSKTLPVRITWMLLYSVPISVIAASYIIILKTSICKGSPRKNNQDSNEFYLRFKILVTITSQLIGSVPVIVGIAVSFSGYEMPHAYHEVIAIVIIPINSILNPILHTSIFKTAFESLKRSL